MLKLLGDEECSAYQVWQGSNKKGFSKDAQFVRKVLEELETIKVLNRDGAKRYGLNISLAPKHSVKEARFGLPSDEKLRGAILEMHSVGFSTDGIAYQTCLPELHVINVINEQNNQK
jgi:post-segregation antitoxin (ccd killing protein)